MNNYYNTIQLVKAGSINSSLCIPGCNRWEYHPTLQQTPVLENFTDYVFNLEVSFYNLQVIINNQKYILLYITV